MKRSKSESSSRLFHHDGLDVSTSTKNDCVPTAFFSGCYRKRGKLEVQMMDLIINR